MRRSDDEDALTLIQLPRLGACPLALGSVRLAEALATREPPSVAGALPDASVFLTRIEVQVDGVLEAAHWLSHQHVYPRVYFSDQHKSLRIAGVGAAEELRSSGALDDAALATTLRRLGKCERMRFYGGMRFDNTNGPLQDEWASYGGSVFILPLWELQVCQDGRSFFACHLRWAAKHTADAPGWEAAARNALLMLQKLCPIGDQVVPPLQGLPTLVGHEGSLNAEDWADSVKTVLEGIEAGKWSKVVLAQRVSLAFNATIEPLHLLQRLLEADDAGIAEEGAGVTRSAASGPHAGPRHAYLFLLQLSADDAFMGCTPEKLFKLEGDQLSTEALAGTRRRGDTPDADSALASELLHNEKDLREVMAVKDFLIKELREASTKLEHSPPFVLQLRHVQHICMPFVATLKTGQQETQQHPVSSALALLHPTPAVCGTPSAAARSIIGQLERFDRGFYAGPLGYIGARGCEFCVAIRSALIRGRKASIFAGAGIVRGSTAVKEWEEVHLKMKNFVAMFPCADGVFTSPAEPFRKLPNLNAVHASLVVEELMRCGLDHFVLSPGSRCAPLTVAVARSGCKHTLANDERGAGFMALGFGRATGRAAAVVVSSGTAVANLLPSVVEAAQDRVPVLFLTADRPPELRDTAANQTVNQVGLLGGNYLRWFKDVPCPTPQTPLEALLSDASYALAKAVGPPAGPVHLNFMLREPLAPSEEPWDKDLLTTKRMSIWLASRQPSTNYLQPYRGVPLQPDAQLLAILAGVRAARRGLIVAGALCTTAQQQATVALAAKLGWPLLPDVASGLRNSIVAPPAPGLHCIRLCDLLLAAEPTLATTIAPDVVLHVGGRLVSKRLQALKASASAMHIVVEEHDERMDPEHSVTHRLQGAIASILGALHVGLQDEGVATVNTLGEALSSASNAAEKALQEAMSDSSLGVLASETWVARKICSELTTSGGVDDEVLFASNSLPIRHLDGFCSELPTVVTNRGASGIDGILHTAIGVAKGSVGRCTLLVGDLATLHDLNSLVTLKQTAVSLVAVILNNQGGGIFRFLPIASHNDIYSPFFDTPHTHTFEGCCQGFGLPYTSTPSRAEFTAAFERARREGGPHVIEVPTNKEEGYAEAARLRAAAKVAAQTAQKAIQVSHQDAVSVE